MAESMAACCDVSGAIARPGMAVDMGFVIGIADTPNDVTPMAPDVRVAAACIVP